MKKSKSSSNLTSEQIADRIFQELKKFVLKPLGPSHPKLDEAIEKFFDTLPERHPEWSRFFRKPKQQST